MVELFNLADSTRCASGPETHISGPIVSVLLYSAFSKLIEYLCNANLGIPISARVEDSGASAPSSLIMEALPIFRNVHESMRST